MPFAGQSDKKRDQKELEQEVLAALATAETPWTAAQVQIALDLTLAVDTVVTVLARLHRQGLVTRVQDGHIYRYAFTGRMEATAAHAAAHKMLQLLAESDRLRVLQLFVGQLPAADRETLRRLIQAD